MKKVVERINREEEYSLLIIPIGADCVAAAIVDVAVVVADGTVVVPVDPCSVDADGCDVPVTDK